MKTEEGLLLKKKVKVKKEETGCAGTHMKQRKHIRRYAGSSGLKGTELSIREQKRDWKKKKKKSQCERRKGKRKAEKTGDERFCSLN